MPSVVYWQLFGHCKYCWLKQPNKQLLLLLSTSFWRYAFWSECWSFCVGNYFGDANIVDWSNSTNTRIFVYQRVFKRMLFDQNANLSMLTTVSTLQVLSIHQFSKYLLACASINQLLKLYISIRIPILFFASNWLLVVDAVILQWSTSRNNYQEGHCSFSVLSLPHPLTTFIVFCRVCDRGDSIHISYPAEQYKNRVRHYRGHFLPSPIAKKEKRGLERGGEICNKTRLVHELGRCRRFYQGL